MKTTAGEIRAKINDLPDDYASHVDISGPGLAEVTSFSNPNQKHHVEIHKDGEGLDATCSCPARTLCKHIVAYYAVAKGIKPVAPIIEEMEKKRTQTSGYGLIAEAIEKLVDGIALVVEEKLRK